MLFNPDVTKQAHKIIFSLKKNNLSNPGLYSNNTKIQWQSVLGLFLNEKFLFLEHIEVKLKKTTEGVNLMP